MSLYHQRFVQRERRACPKCGKVVTVHRTTGRLHQHRCIPRTATGAGEQEGK